MKKQLESQRTSFLMSLTEVWTIPEKSERRPALLAIALMFVVLVVYAPAATRSYGFMDDYSLLNDSFTGPRIVADFCIASGRSIYGAILELSLSFCRSIGDLCYIRLGGILGLGLAGASVYFLLRRAVWPNSIAWLTALAVCFTPSAQVGAYWGDHLASICECGNGSDGFYISRWNWRGLVAR